MTFSLFNTTYCAVCTTLLPLQILITTMTTNRQRSRSAVEVQEQRAITGWTQLFPAKQETEQQSLTFVKKLVSATMSTVTYVRNVFDQKAYTRRALGGTPLMILNSKTNCDKAKTFSKWLLGAFEKKYLREMALVVYLDAAHPEEVAEVYTVKVSYPGGLPSCKVGLRLFDVVVNVCWYVTSFALVILSL